MAAVLLHLLRDYFITDDLVQEADDRHCPDIDNSETTDMVVNIKEPLNFSLHFMKSIINTVSHPTMHNEHSIMYKNKHCMYLLDS